MVSNGCICLFCQWRLEEITFSYHTEVADPDTEDGEILEEEDKIKYDLSKLIQFPGFNAPLPENTVDVSKNYGFIDT